MWRTVAEILGVSGLDELPDKTSQPQNVMQFVLLPTIKSLLLERADAGDVQTCVTLCEVLQVIEADETTRIPGLSLNIVREWYLAYIDLLRDMCLFSLASVIIGTCKDSFIGALNQQSTT
jgi:WD repeat-containing protein 24